MWVGVIGDDELLIKGRAETKDLKGKIALLEAERKSHLSQIAAFDATLKREVAAATVCFHPRAYPCPALAPSGTLPLRFETKHSKPLTRHT